MSSLSHAARFVTAGSQLHAELSRLLRGGMGYTIQGAADILAHIDAHGTATDSAADLEDVADINALVVKHFAPVESDPADWPACFDEDVWSLTPAEPANAPLPPSEAFGGDYEPSLEDRRAWAEALDRDERLDSALDRLEVEGRALELVTAGLDAFPAISGGAATPDERPIKLRDQSNAAARARHHRGQTNMTDEDVITATGCCG